MVESTLRRTGGGESPPFTGERGRFAVWDADMTSRVLCKLLAPKTLHRDGGRTKQRVPKISRVSSGNQRTHQPRSAVAARTWLQKVTA